MFRLEPESRYHCTKLYQKSMMITWHYITSWEPEGCYHYSMMQKFTLYLQLRDRRALSIFREVPFRTKKSLSLYKSLYQKFMVIAPARNWHYIISWEPEGCYHCFIAMFHWEPERCFRCIKVYGSSALLVLNVTSLNSINSLLVLGWWYVLGNPQMDIIQQTVDMMSQNLRSDIIQILTGTVMKYHVSVDCQESYIFPRDYIFPKCTALRENITILAPPTRDISSVPLDICYIRWSKLMISSIVCALRLPRSLVTRLGVCVQNKTTQRKLDSLRAFYYDVLLLTTAYSVYAVHFFLGHFPNMELMLLLLSPLFYLLNCYIFVIASLRLL